MHPIRSARQWARGRSSHVPAFVALVAMGVLAVGGPGATAATPAPTDRDTLVASLLHADDVPDYTQDGEVRDVSTDDIPAFAAHGGIREVSGGWSDDVRTSAIYDFRFQFPDEASAAAFLDEAEDLLGEVDYGSVREDPPVQPLPDTRYLVYHDTRLGTGSDGHAYLMRHGNLVAKVWVSGVDGNVAPEDAGAIAQAAADRMVAALDEGPAPSQGTETGAADPADVALLLAHIPDAVGAHCVADDTDRAARYGEQARVLCTQSDVASVVFSRYDTTDSLDTAFDVAVAVAEAMGSEPASTCEAGSFDGSWQLGDETAGRLLCTVQAGSAVIVWSHPATRILSTIRQTDGDTEAAWQLWLVAGPE